MNFKKSSVQQSILKIPRSSMNQSIKFLKWPFLLWLLLCLPAVLKLTVDSLAWLYKQPVLLGFVTVGMAIYAALVWMLNRTGSQSGSLSVLMTLEHELAHAMFALLTFNGVRSVHASAGEGGHVRLSGGNWLVTAAPYFLPLPVLVLWPVFLVSVRPYSRTLLVVLGVALAFHVHATWRETRFVQPDLQELGKTFSILFLPLAHVFTFLWCVGLLKQDQRFFTQALAGGWSVLKYFKDSLIKI